MDYRFMVELRNYFAEHDKTVFEHRAFAVLDSDIKLMNMNWMNENTLNESLAVPSYYVDSYLKSINSSPDKSRDVSKNEDKEKRYSCMYCREKFKSPIEANEHEKSCGVRA